MSILALLATVLACVVVLRSLLLLFYAEAGRKQDLIKHIYKSGTDFHIALIIPYLDSRKLGAFQELLRALSNQDYPTNRIGIHVVATEESAYALPQVEELPGNVKTWTFPAKSTGRGIATSWLVERLLAAGGPSRLFVFLDADDIVRPDFLKNVTTRAYDCFAMQGYIALKRPAKGLLSYVVALSNRLMNRIENAGRYHMGLSCRLMNSGWVVRQELLEMLPFTQGEDLDNLEYSTLLNLQGYRVNWAPNVVVYKEERVDFIQQLKDISHSMLNRVRLTLQYAPQLLFQGATRLEPTLFESLWGLVKPSNFVLGALFAWITLKAASGSDVPGGLFLWSTLTVTFAITQLISLTVARCNLKDVVGFIALTPIVYAVGGIVFPLTLVMALFESTFHLVSRPKKVRVGKRFDESQDALLAPSSEIAKTRNKKADRRVSEAQDTWDFVEDSETFDAATDYSRKKFGLFPQTEKAPIASSVYETHHLEENEVPILRQKAVKPGITQTETLLPITNGKGSVTCTLKTLTETDTNGEEAYALLFEYKHLAFKTQKYRILDQAYYELETKLQAKGFSIVSCGSCAYFYRPTAGNAYGVAKNIGFCLFRKEGRDVNIQDDGVTVLSESCDGYTDMVQRPAAVRRWQESLAITSQH